MRIVSSYPRSILFIVVGLVALGPVPAASGVASAAEAARPNVVFILADDLGWSDTTLNGTTSFYRTPNLERLARRGMTFANAYAAAPICSPTRASILTGLYPGRLGITTPSCHEERELLAPTVPPRGRPDQPSLQPQSATRLKLEYVTLAETLHAAGYRTAHFGKWHVGREPYDALHQGFDVDIPHTPNAPGPGPSYLAPWKFVADPKFVGETGAHIEDRLSQEAARFIREHKSQPFYVNYWAYSVHSPWNAKPESIEAFASSADPKSPQHNPLYAAMVKSLDDAVGRLLDALDESGLAQRTIVVFFSDNGGYAWPPKKSDPPEYAETPATSNAPLRAGKGTLYEGGTREPCVVAWPPRVRGGSRSEALLSSVDFYPTLLELCGLPTPAGVKFDGISQVAALEGKESPREAVYCYYPHYNPPPSGTLPGAYVRRGDRKLVRLFHAGPEQADRFELYDLKADPGETHDLAAENPTEVSELAALLARHLDEIGAIIPGPNPAYSPEAARVFQRTLWQANSECALSLQDGVLVVRKQGANPSLSTRLEEPIRPPRPFTLEVRWSSSAAGPARFFWQESGIEPPMHRDRSRTFEVAAGDAARTYRLEFSPKRALMALRLDPPAKAESTRIESIRLLDAQGKEVQGWQFDAPDQPAGR